MNEPKDNDEAAQQESCARAQTLSRIELKLTIEQPSSTKRHPQASNILEEILAAKRERRRRPKKPKPQQCKQNTSPN